jgi:drug/metabolite transporter (DMT)-like permease
MAVALERVRRKGLSLHGLGVVCGLTAGVWLGAAEAPTLDGGMHSPAFQLLHMPGVLFWLFLGGFVWVVGDLFQQFAAKYLGIGCGIPLSNTNQLWGLAWGVLVFGELAKADRQHRWMVIGGSVLMILERSRSVRRLLRRRSRANE